MPRSARSPFGDRTRSGRGKSRRRFRLNHTRPCRTSVECRDRSGLYSAFNASRLATTIVVPLTSNLRLAAAPGNVVLAARRTGLPKDSVANVSQIITIDRELLSDRVGQLIESDLQLVLAGIDIVLGRE